MKKFIVLALWAFSCRPLLAISMNFNGQVRSEASHYQDLGLGTGSLSSSKNFIQMRALLDPNLIIDDHFSIKSEWSLLTSPSFTPNATIPLGSGAGGWIFGDVNSAALVLTRAWLEWTSDFGVFRLGRMPVSWGYGLLYDAGNGLWDDFQTTYDRIEYRLHLGHVIGAVAYSKPRKFTAAGSDNDQDFYQAFLQYDNPESEIEGGILYEKQVRGSQQQGDLLGTSNPAVPSNPYKLPASDLNPYPLSNKTPYPLSNNVVDLYLKKTLGYLTLGGEVGWIVGTAAGYSGNGVPDNLNAFAVTLNASYEVHRLKIFTDFLYASGDNNLNGGHLNGFVLLHRNRRPGLILGRELLGPYYTNLVGYGSPVVYGAQDTFSGVIYLRPGVRFDWTPSLSSGLELILAQKAAVTDTDSKNLGIEVDIGTEFAMYKNFDLGGQVGYLFPGDGLQVPNPKGAFAGRATAALKF